MNIVIPIDDWHDDAMRSESEITSRDDVLKQIDDGTPTAVVARRTLVWREKGVAPNDMMQPNKLLLQAGAREEISRMVRSQRHAVNIGGKLHKAPSYVGPIRTPENEAEKEPTEDGESVTMQTTMPGFAADMPKSYIKYTDRRAGELAENYILNVVPGYVYPRLLTIRESGGSMDAVLDALIDKLNAIRAELK